MRQSTTTLILSLLSLTSFATAQTTAAATTSAAAAAASPDGLIVPFKSSLPACASKCGPLFDVQGKCSPPNIAAVDDNCFCTDSRLAALKNGGTTGVTLVCGAQSCTTDTDLTAIKKWFTDFCATDKVVTTTASNGAVATQTGTSKPKTSSSSSGSSSPTWISTHYKWVIMICVIFVAIVGGWIGACLLRRRYLRRKEREIEMKPPVAWGPHQMQGATGGYNYGDGIVDASRGVPNNAGGHAKEFAAASVTAADGRKAKRESKMQKKNRSAS